MRFSKKKELYVSLSKPCMLLTSRFRTVSNLVRIHRLNPGTQCCIISEEV